MKSVELFAGAGGLAMGATLAGFRHLAVVEWDQWACDTIRENQRRGHPLVQHWPLWQGDVRGFDWNSIPEGVELLAGGPPCQPFSLGGKHRAFGDERNMFPATVEIIRRLAPKAFVIENVKGLARARFSNYLQYILLQMEFPEISLRKGEAWEEHLRRLQREKTSSKKNWSGLRYNVVHYLVNAANHGVPQRRERIFIVGFRNDLEVEWSFPEPTHSLDALLYSQWISGEYWERHQIPRSRRPAPPPRFLSRIRRLEGMLPTALPEKPWRTIRDALSDMPEPNGSSSSFHNHFLQPGAKVYKGHTGSPLDLPAKTIKAGDHGVPGGENMMVRPDGSVRYFTIRETARLQTFPDGYVFHGSWTETMRQLGNAVPVALARLVCASVAEKLALSMSETARAGASRRVA